MINERYDLYSGILDTYVVYYLVDKNESIVDFVSLYYASLLNAKEKQYRIFQKYHDFALCLN